MKYAMLLFVLVAFCPSTKYELLEVVSGNLWVRDHDLSRDDCLRQLARSRAHKPKGDFFCQPQKGERVTA